MKYMGSKNRIAKHLLPIMLASRTEGMNWVEPFVGGANMIDKVDGERIGADFNEYLIDFFNELKKGWTPPKHVTKEEYYAIKENKEDDTKMTLWAGICCSYGGKWFGGYADDYPESRRLKNGNLPNYQKESRNSVLKQSENLKGVKFVHSSYQDLEIPLNSLIYCDPPYEGTTKYKDGFKHAEFWEWCRTKSKEGHKVFISEYNAPADFECVKEVSTNTQLSKGNIKKTEKLFIYNPNKALTV